MLLNRYIVGTNTSTCSNANQNAYTLLWRDGCTLSPKKHSSTPFTKLLESTRKYLSRKTSHCYLRSLLCSDGENSSALWTRQIFPHQTIHLNCGCLSVKSLEKFSDPFTEGSALTVNETSIQSYLRSRLISKLCKWYGQLRRELKHIVKNQMKHNGIPPMGTLPQVVAGEAEAGAPRRY